MLSAKTNKDAPTTTGCSLSNPTAFWHGLTWIAAAVHSAITATLSLTRLYTHKASLLDLGVFDQAIWTTLTYGVPTTTINFPYETHNWLGFHFSPIVLSLVPVYAVAAVPELLILLQSVLIAVTAVPLFWTCLRLSGFPRHAFFWSMVYLFNPFLLNAAVWDFHELSFALPAVAFAYYGLVERRLLIFIVAMVWLLLCKEHYGVAVLGFGLLWGYFHSDRKTGWMLATGGIAVTLFVLFVAMPALNPTGERPMIGGGNPLLGRYAWLSQAPSQWIATVLNLLPDWLLYVSLLLLPIGRAAVMAPAFLMPGMADLSANLLSLNPMPRSLFAYHSMTLVPVLIVAAARASAVRPASSAAFLKTAFLITLILGYLLMPAPLPLAQNVWRIESIHLTRDPAIRDIRRFLDPEQTVSAQANVGSFFSQRRSIFPFPARLDEADAVVLHVEYPYTDFQYAPYANPYSKEMMKQVLRAMEKLVVGSSDFGLLYWERNWLLAVRGEKDRVNRDDVRRRVSEFVGEYDAGRLSN